MTILWANQPHALEGGTPRPCHNQHRWSTASDAERWLAMKRKRQVLLSVCGLMAVYFTVYALNSICGGYKLIFVSSISHPINYEMGTDSTASGGAIAWQPRYGNYTRLTSDALGKAFYPLILIDQTLWHRDIAASEVGSREEFEKRVPLRKVHPDDRNFYGAKRLG